MDEVAEDSELDLVEFRAGEWRAVAFIIFKAGAEGVRQSSG